MTGARFADVPWIEPVALLGARQRAARVSDAARVRMKPWVEAAHARYRVARELRDSETQIVALSLLREAAFFALVALALAREEEAPKTLGAAWTGCEMPSAGDTERAAELSLVRAAFSAEDPLALDRTPAGELNALRLAAESTVAWLLALAEVRSPRELERLRLIRAVLCTLAALGILSGLIAYGCALASVSPR